MSVRGQERKAMEIGIERKRIDKISKDLVLEELRRVAEHYENRRFTQKEFNEVAKSCKGTTVLRAFGSWGIALDAIGVELKPRKTARKDQVPIEDLFNEMERIWKLNGQRPSKTEWEILDPKYAYSTYYKRFSGWLNACAAYIDYKSGGSIPELEQFNYEAKESSKPVGRTKTIAEEEKREIPLKLRLQVLKRDKFKCVYCGRSPATEAGVTLHIDHITPFSKGGKTTLGNLQTLCEKCNWGKGDEL